jgi:hypothetical protein
MTLVYARIANRVVADEYNAVMEGRRALQDGGGSDGISG